MAVEISKCISTSDLVNTKPGHGMMSQWLAHDEGKTSTSNFDKSLLPVKKWLLNHHWMLVVMVIALALLMPTKGSAQGFGPRAFQLIPDGVDSVALYGFAIEGNSTIDPSVVIQGSEIDIDLAVLQYSHTFEFNEQQSGLLAIVSGGTIEGSLDLGGQTLSDKSSGFGDVQVGAVFGLTGSPVLSMEEFQSYKPGFAAGLLTLLTLPTGEYDESSAINVGANRWAAQVGTVLVWYQGQSMLDPKLRTFELVPSITLYSDNDDPFGADRTGQSAMFKLEGHITQNINKAMFVSLDALYSYGGETTTDGADNNNQQSALMLGASFNAMISRSASIKLSYGKVVSRNDDGPDGSMIRAIVSVLF